MCILFKKRIQLFVFLFLLMGVGNLHCNGQIKPVPHNIIPPPYQQDAINQEYVKYKTQAFDLTANLPRGYDRNGKVDYTKQLQQGIDTHDIVVLPNMPILINETGLTLKTNNVLLFQPKSKLILKPTSKDTYEILRIHGISDVKVYNANIEGDAKNHKGKSGEWGMGIAVRTSRNVGIFNATITNCWGDGIYIGTLVEKVNGRARWVGPSENINIFNAYIDANRRNGLSLVSVKECRVYNSLFSNTRGTFPKSGIDIEPHNFADKIDIKNVVTYYNGQDGIVISLVDIVKSKIKDHGVNISIDNHKDFNSNMGLRLTGYRDFKKEEGYLPVNGLVKITNSIWKNNPYGSLVIQSNQSLGPTVKFINNSAGQQKNAVELKGKAIKNLPTAREGLTGKHSINFQ